MPDPALILASSSRYRAALLERLNLPFTAISPDIDESQRRGESPHDYVLRLSVEKAQAVANDNPNGLVIGSDQCALYHDDILGKPGTVANAEGQLAQFSGDHVVFLTGLCLFDPRTQTIQKDVIQYVVHFRDLSAEQISAYVAAEQPLDCAGSFKSEGLGVSLFERMSGDDPTALIGLPLIRLTSFLLNTGINVPTAP